MLPWFGDTTEKLISSAAPCTGDSTKKSDESNWIIPETCLCGKESATISMLFFNGKTVRFFYFNSFSRVVAILNKHRDANYPSIISFQEKLIFSKTRASGNSTTWEWEWNMKSKCFRLRSGWDAHDWPESRILNVEIRPLDVRKRLRLRLLHWSQPITALYSWRSQ